MHLHACMFLTGSIKIYVFIQLLSCKDCYSEGFLFFLMFSLKSFGFFWVF